MNDIDPVRAARLKLGSQLAYLRKAAGLTQNELAPLVGYSRTTVANIEVGRQLAERTFWVRTDSALSTTGTLTLAYDSLERYAYDTTDMGADLLEDGRRRRAHTADVAAIRAVADAFTRADLRVGGGRLYEAVAIYLETEVGPRLVEPTQGAALFAAASSLASVAAWMAHDGGENATSRSHFRQAYQLAVASGNTAVVADVCTGMAHLATELGKPRDAVRIAEQGLQRVAHGSRSSRVVSRLHAMRARGLALAGERAATYAALRMAEQALNQAGPTESEEWVSPFDQASLSAETALSLRDVGDLIGAEHHARVVLQLRGGERLRSRSLGQLTLAHTLLARRRLDEAAQLGHLICNATTALTSARVHNQLRDLDSQLISRSSSSVVSQLHERLIDMTSRKRDNEESEWPL